MEERERATPDRSVELMSVGDTALLVVDVQEKLMPAIGGGDRVVWNVRRLIDGAIALGLPVLATEQYPKGLGPTAREIAERVGTPREKMSFSCCGGETPLDAVCGEEIHKVLLCGVETHVCVQQTALDLMAAGWRVYVAVDAVGSRMELDHATALRRMDSAGATLTTTEAALFEWCERADHPQFKTIRQLVLETPPA